jgi:hypothetical protein
MNLFCFILIPVLNTHLSNVQSMHTERIQDEDVVPNGDNNNSRPHVFSSVFLKRNQTWRTCKWITLWRLNFFYVIYKKLAHTSKETHYISRYRDVWGKSCCLLWQPYGTHRYATCTEYRVSVC